MRGASAARCDRSERGALSACVTVVRGLSGAWTGVTECASFFFHLLCSQLLHYKPCPAPMDSLEAVRVLDDGPSDPAHGDTVAARGAPGEGTNPACSDPRHTS